MTGPVDRQATSTEDPADGPGFAAPTEGARAAGDLVMTGQASDDATRLFEPTGGAAISLESPRHEPPTATAAAPVDAADRREPGARLMTALCPYLEVAGARWRYATPSRDHRCTAIRPPSPLTIDKQRRLCVVAAHVTCPAYVAAADARRAWPGLPLPAGAGSGAEPPEAFANRWGLTRTAPVVTRPVRLGASLQSGSRQRLLAQAALVGVLLLAFAAIAVARFPGDEGAALLVPTPSPLPTASPTPTPTPTPTPSPTIEISPSPTIEPTPPPTPTPVPTIPTTTYRVASGDTLSGIATRFHTTVKAIMDLNHLTTTNLRVGQLLQIPAPPG